MADRLAKKAATDDKGEIVYDKIPRETIVAEGNGNRITKYQALDKRYKRTSKQIIFPILKRENEDHDTYLS